MEKERLKRLLKEYQTGTIKKNDLVDLLAYVARAEHEPVIDQLLAELVEEMEEDTTLPLTSDSLYERITNHPQFQPLRQKTAKLWYRWISVAAAVIVVFGGFWWYAAQNNGSYHENQDREVRTVTSAPSDKLILKTGSGLVIDLDSELSDTSSEIATLHFSENGSLNYEIGGNIVYPEEHTIMTPKGRQYHIVLSDGTKVWLNNATTMTFPVNFDSNLREIKLDGEAYFEVKSDSDWPFVVHADKQRIEVLGTHFNVNAYSEDEMAYTTLLEGKVNVSTAKQKTALRPGQQAKTMAQSSVVEVKNVDVADVLAWRDNMFTFNNEKIQQVMRQVSRWYDVEVVYLDGMEGKRIGGSIPRFRDIGELMEALEATGLLHYQMKGGQIIIKE